MSGRDRSGSHRESGVLSEVAMLLRDALVAAYPVHVRSRLGSVDGLDGVLAEGADWLDASLTKLLSQPFVHQRRGPLELFQEAMRFPTDYLVELGVPPSKRDPTVVSALPGDLYDLAPASTRELGEEVWSRHLAWGAAKAVAIRSGQGPPVGER